MLVLQANHEQENTFQKLIQTMGVQVAWEGRFIVVDDQLILGGKVRSLCFQLDTKKVVTDLVDIPVEESQVLEVAEHPKFQDLVNMLLYAFGKWGTLKGLRVGQDFPQLNELFGKILASYYIEPSFRKENFRFYKVGVRITYEEVLATALEFEQKLEDDPQAESQGLWHKLIWKNRQKQFQKAETTLEERAGDRIGSNFYLVGYQCPECSQKLHMAVYPEGKEIRIDTEEKGVYLARVYTCNVCNCFYTPRPGRLIAEGLIYEMDFGIDQKAYEDYLELLGRNAERAANFKYNEYEALRSQRLKQEQKEAGAYPDGSDYLHSPKEALDQMEDFSKRFEGLPDEVFRRFAHRVEEGFYPDAAVARHEKKILEQVKKRDAVLRDAASQEGNLGNGTGRDRSGLGGKEEGVPMPGQAVGMAPGAGRNGAGLGSAGASARPADGIRASGSAQSVRNADMQRLTEEGTQFNGAGTGMQQLTGAGTGMQQLAGVGTGTQQPSGGTGMRQLSGSMGAYRDAGRISRSGAGLGQDTGNGTRLGQGAGSGAGLGQGAGSGAGLGQDAGSGAELGNGTGDVESGRNLPDAASRNPNQAKNTEAIGKYQARLGVLDRLSERQKAELKRQVTNDASLSEEEKRELLRPIEEAQVQAKAAAIAKKVEGSPNRSYAQIRKAMQEVGQEELPEETKRIFLDRLQEQGRQRGAKEVRQIMEKVPERLDRAGYKKLEQQLEAYKDVDLSPYAETLRQKREGAEKQEIANMVKRSRKKSRGDLVGLMRRLEEQEFADENVGPYMDKIKEKVQSLDEERLDELLGQAQQMDFDAAAAVYEQIDGENFLPELKSSALEMLSKRLEKIRTDECELLVHKLQDEMEGKVKENARHHFYPARKVMLKTAEPEETRAIDAALSAYATGRSLFEYPILTVDTSRGHSGREGMVLTPENLFYSTRLSAYAIPVSSIGSIQASTGLLNRKLTLEETNGAKHKLPYAVGAGEMQDWAAILEGFVQYLQEKPASRKLKYLAKETHDTICCYRCGYVYHGRDVCPECGYKKNR